MAERIDRLYMSELITLIRKRDNRSGVAWCKNHNVDVYIDRGDQYVLELEFNEAYNLPAVNRFKEKYKENWEIEYELAQQGKKGQSPVAAAARVRSNGRYKPKGKDSEDFMKRFKK